MSRKHCTIVLSAVAILAFGLTAAAQAEILFADNFDNAGTPAAADWALNANLTARQAEGTLGTLNWGRDKRTAVSGQEQYIQVNHATWGVNKLDFDGNSSYSGHSAIIQKDFNTGTYASKIAASHGFTVRFDIDPVSACALTSDQHGYGGGVFIGALDGSESNIPSTGTIIPGRTDPKVDLAIHFVDKGSLYLYHGGTLTGTSTGVTFDTARAAEIADDSNSYAKMYTFELRVTTDNFNSGTTASATLWWGSQGTASDLLTQAALASTAATGFSADLKTYTWQWDAEGTGFCGLYNYQSASTQSQFDNYKFSVAIPEPSTLALLACGLIGLLAYAWRRSK